MLMLASMQCVPKKKLCHTTSNKTSFREYDFFFARLKSCTIFKETARYIQRKCNIQRIQHQNIANTDWPNMVTSYAGLDLRNHKRQFNPTLIRPNIAFFYLNSSLLQINYCAQIICTTVSTSSKFMLASGHHSQRKVLQTRTRNISENF